MAKIQSRQRGFSLVELLVALTFTMVLMAGMANVYKASIGSFYTSGESLSNVRRNRLSVDLLADDINAACMYLMDLSSPPVVSAQVPPFFILPNVPITGSSDPASADQVYFYLDQPLAFEGTLASFGGDTGGDLAWKAGTADQAPEANDFTYTIDCGSATYANQVQQGQVFFFKDSWEAGYISAAPVVSGTKVTVVAGPSPSAAITGTGPSGLPSKARHLAGAVGTGTGIVFMVPAQMVRYRIVMLQLDPDPLKPNGIPCLVREQAPYNSTAFAANPTQQVISENVSGFKVYLSSDAGTTWAGLGSTKVGFSAGWDLGIRTDLDNQLVNSGRPGYTSTRGTDEHWFRSIPTLVRVDVSTRTATQRAEYSTTGTTLAYRNLTQSLVFVPKHSGLPMN